MSVNVIFGGTSYVIPQTGDSNWGDSVTEYLQQIAAYSFQNPADFSNSTLTSRQVLQTITANAPTNITVAPSGTSVVSSLQLYSDSQLANGSEASLTVDPTTLKAVVLGSTAIGTGTNLPISINIGNNPAIYIESNDKVLINTSTDNGSGAELQINGSVSATNFIGTVYSSNIGGGAAGDLVYQTAPNTTGFISPGASGSLLASTGTGLAWMTAPSGVNTPYVSALNYCTSQANTGGVNHGGTVNSSSNIVTIAPGPFIFTPAMVGSNIYVSGMSQYTTIASYISPTQVTMAINAGTTQTLSTVVVWNSGQDDTAGINATLAAATGSQSLAYFPTRVYVYASEIDMPSNVQGIIADGLNRTFFICKTKSNTVTGNFLDIQNAPSDFTLGGFNKGFTVIGPGVYSSQQLHHTSLSITNGTITTVVDNSLTATVGQIYKITGARGAASVYNDTYWKVTSSSSTGWSGVAYYWDQNPVNGTISSVAVDGSGNVTVLENNQHRKVGYQVTFSGLSNATFLNGQTLTVSSIVYSGNTVTGYVYSSAFTTYSATSDSGLARYLPDTSTVTDNFVAFPDWNGIRISSNVFPAGTNIAIHLNMYGISVQNFGGAGFRMFTPNFGYSGVLTANNNSEGFAIESTYPTTGFFSNPSAYEIGGGCEFEGNTFVGFYGRDFGGAHISMPAGGGSGIGMLLYGCNGTVVSGFDLEVQTPWSGDTTLYPGNTIELRACGNVLVTPGYLSFNSSTSQIGVYMWNGSTGCKYIGGRHYLAGSLVQPANEFYIDASCYNCSVDNPRLAAGLSSTNWTNLSQTSYVIEGGNYWYGGQNTNSFNVYNPAPATSGTNHSSPLFEIAGTYWNGSSSATDAYSFQAVPGSGTNPTSILNLVHNGSSGGSLFEYNNGVFQVSGSGQTTLQVQSSATSINNYNSPSFCLDAAYWTGTATAFDQFAFQNNVGTGANPTATLQISHTGTTGSQYLAIQSSIAVNVNSGTLNVTNASGSSLVTIKGTTLAQTIYESTTNSQIYNFGYNQSNALLSIYDAKASATRLSIADTTGVVTIPTSIASTSATTGSLVVSGGLGITGAIYGASSLTVSGGVSSSAHTITNSSNPSLFIVDSTTGQQWTIGENTTNTNLTVYDTTHTATRLTIANSSGQVNIPTVIAATSPTTGSLTIAGGLGVAGNIFTGGFSIGTTQGGITATGSTQGGAYQLSNMYNNVTSSTASTGLGVILPPGIAGMMMIVNNTSANAINVYPYGSETINGASGGTPKSVPAGDAVLLVAFGGSPNAWVTMKNFV